MMGAVVNHLWQSTWFAAGAGILTVGFRRNHAGIRFGLWFAASVKFLIPFALLMAIGSHLEWKSVAAGATEAVANTVVRITEPFAAASSSVAPSPETFDWVSIGIFALWACGFVAVLLMRLKGWLRIRAAVHTSTQMDIPSPVEIRSAAGLLEPGVVGLFHPVLLLPSGILKHLTPAEFAAVLAHELCHVRRRDNLLAFVHMVVEMMFWFHPLVWRIGARLVVERERACDEHVLRLGSEPRVYAEAILNVCKYHVASPLACVSGITGSDLRNRIARILAPRSAQNLTLRGKFLLSAAETAAMLAPIAIGILAAPRTQAQASRVVPRYFDVASIKLNQTGGESRRAGSSPGGRFTATNVTLRLLISRAFGVAESQIEGGPGWINSETYDIAAKADTPLEMSRQEVRPCLQALLAERFRLKFHREARQGSVYSLLVGKNGPKLTVHSTAGSPAIGASTGAGEAAITGTRVTMALLAEYLSGQAGRPVIDNTGLGAEYDLRVKWSTDEAVDGSGPSIFTALEEQLGLKLDATKGPIETIVIDGAEKPSAN